MTNETVHVLPDGDLLTALSNQNISYRDGVCELVDNCIDAGATDVHVEVGPEHGFLRVTDNGRGKEDLTAFIRLGRHEGTKSTRSGIYGIGIKDAALSLGGIDSWIRVRSVCGGMERRLSVQWSDYRDRQWGIDLPTVFPKPGPTGTVVEFEPLVRRFNSPQRLIEDLSYIYSPVLQRGKVSIRVTLPRQETVALAPWQLPPMEEGSVVEDTIEVDGRRAMIRAGIVKAGERNPRAGLTYMHGIRVLIQARPDSCAPYGGQRVAGWVKIDDSWSRHKNKNGFADEDLLFKAVVDRLTPMLVLAREQERGLQSEELCSELNRMMNSNVGGPKKGDGPLDSKAKRGPRVSSGSHSQGDGSGPHHMDARRKQPGSSMPSGQRTIGNIHVEFTDKGAPTPIGEVSGSIVYLNVAHPCVKMLKDNSQKHALAVMAASLMCNDVAIRGDKQLRFQMHAPEERESEVENFAHLVAAMLMTITA